jgi:hypothetical protein
MEGDAVNRPGMTSERADFLAARELPKLDRIIEPGRRQQFAVGAKGDRVY